MVKFIDLTGQKFGRLTVIERAKNDIRQCSQWLCKCDCGREVTVSGNHLKTNHTRSCGCLQKEICAKLKRMPKHNMAHSKIYKKWNSIKNRTNPNSKYKNTKYKNYSGRGIAMCDEWFNKENGFMNFYNWAMNNGYKDNLTIDRIDVNGDYEPNNCRWTTMKQQQNNKRNNVIIEYNGEIHTLTEWNEKLNFTKGLLKNRLKRGWSVEKAFTTPKRGSYGE